MTKMNPLKCTPEDILSMEKGLWTRHEVMFGLANRVIESLHNDPLVVIVRLNRDVKWVLMDTGNSINLVTLEVYNKLDLDKNSLTKVSYPLLGLGDKIMVVLGTVNLHLVLGDEKHKQEIYAEFAVVNIPLAYNIILGHSIPKCHGIVINMGSLFLKLLASGRLAVV